MSETDRRIDKINTFDYKARRNMPGRRLDVYLAAKYSNYSRTFLNKLVKEGKVTINGEQVKPHYELKRYDKIHVELPVFHKATLVPENIPIDVIHEDDYLLIINKPADIIVHPARGNMTGTLVNALVFYCDTLPEGETEESKIRPGIIHRLDRDTTGAMIIVKDEASRGWIGKQFEDRQIKKEYLTIVEGMVELDEDIIRLPIGRHKKCPEKMAVDRMHGREAVTIYHVEERFKGFTLLRVQIKTGRTHQIRVHMAAIGHPVTCDAQYGRREELYLSELNGGEHTEGEEPIIDRQALHAHNITFNHPGSKRLETYTAPLPKDMTNLLEALREHRAL